MTQEDKELLLKDLCSRLPFRVRFKTKHGHDLLEDIDCFDLLDVRINTGNEDSYALDEIKPYLFPLSSITEEQTEELIKLINTGQNDNNEFMRSLCRIDFYHKNHFDYRGLIEKGLAIDATNLNIY